jgi:hypothetical protein
MHVFDLLLYLMLTRPAPPPPQASALLHWLHGCGHKQLCISGKSAGGEIGGMVASSIRSFAISTAAFLPAHSVAVLTTVGAMRTVSDYERLAELSAEQGAPQFSKPGAAFEEVRRLTDATNIQNFQPPLCTEACIIVAAANDSFVPPYSPRIMHSHWPGSKLRWVWGGHALSMRAHNGVYVSTVVEALCRLREHHNSALYEPPVRM